MFNHITSERDLKRKQSFKHPDFLVSKPFNKRKVPNSTKNSESSIRSFKFSSNFEESRLRKSNELKSIQEINEEIKSAKREMEPKDFLIGNPSSSS
jgi:hypothetical protein